VGALLHALTLLALIALAGCGAGNGEGDEADDSAPATQAGVLQLGSATQSVGEASGVVTVTVTRTGGSDGAVSATLATADGTTTAGQDFTAVSATVSFAAGDSASKTIDIRITDDAAVETTEVFAVALSAPTGGATLGSVSLAAITIQDNDVAGPASGHELNDTGVTQCSNALANGLACNSVATGTDQFPGQDAQQGRDATAGNANDGVAGFSFIKLDDAGLPLPDQSVAFNVRPWACVRDNVTGLVWEVKTDDDGLRDKDWRYSWFDTSGIADGGDAGQENRGACVNAADCDTQKYRDAVNAAALCGRTDWRLPVRSELLSIIHYGSSSAPLVDADFFPQSANAAYWTGSALGSQAWAVSLATGDAGLLGKDAAGATRMVSDGGGL
jgi:hypothetical protein